MIARLKLSSFIENRPRRGLGGSCIIDADSCRILLRRIIFPKRLASIVPRLQASKTVSCMGASLRNPLSPMKLVGSSDSRRSGCDGTWIARVTGLLTFLRDAKRSGDRRTQGVPPL